MTGRAMRESHSHETEARVPLLLPFAPSRTQGIVGVHVRYAGAYLSQANDKGLDLFWRKSRQQPLLSCKCCNDNAVVKRVTGSGQSHDPRAVVLGIRLTCNKSFVFKYVQTSADCAFVESDRVDDLVGTDIRHSREHAHHAPLGDAKAEVLPVGVGCAARQSVRDVSEKIRDVSIEIEHGAAGYGCGSLTNVFLLHELPRNFSKENSVTCIRPKIQGDDLNQSQSH